jgi:hypothetical protein
MRYILVLQFHGKSLEDFDALVELEESINQKLHGLVEADGHDFGSGEGNIFLGTNEPQQAFKGIKAMVGIDCLAEMRAAYREKDSERYELLWPPDLKKFAVK